MLTLYDHPLSPYAQKCKIALDEKSVPFEAQIPEGLGSGQVDEAFRQANARGEVPTLLDGQAAIFDSTIILEYIEDKWPDPALLPKDPVARARARMIEDVMDTHFEPLIWGLWEVRYFKRGEGTDLPAKLEARIGAQLKGLFAWLERQLGDGPWFGGDRFGWADVSAVPYVSLAAGDGFTPGPGSKLGQWLERTKGRRSVTNCAKAVEEIGGTAVLAGISDLVKEGLFQREYRDHRLEWMIRSGGIDIVLEGMEMNTIRFSNELS